MGDEETSKDEKASRDPLRAAIYCRQSLEEVERQEESIPAQLEACLAFCMGKGWAVVVTKEDRGSGLDPAALRQLNGTVVKGREGLGWLLDHHSRWDIIVARSRRRLFRGRKHIIEFLEKSHERGKRIWTVKEGNLTAPKRSAAWAGDAFMEVVGELESRQIAERVLDGMTRAKRQGKHVGRPPAGFRVTEEGELEPTEWALRVREDAESRGALEAARRNPYERGKQKGRPPSIHTVWKVVSNLKAWTAGELGPNRKETEPGSHSKFWELQPEGAPPAEEI